MDLLVFTKSRRVSMAATRAAGRTDCNRQSDASRKSVIARDRPYGTDNSRGAWLAAMSDILKIGRFVVPSECERHHRRDRHPVSAQGAWKEKARQFRLHNPLAAHDAPHLCIAAIRSPIHKNVNKNVFAAQSLCSIMLVQQSALLDDGLRFAAKATVYLCGQAAANVAKGP
jgi:hypothetical protein